MNLNNELKQCPFCGREAELRHDEEGFSYVVCANDGCYVRTAGDLNDDAAIRNWNKRDQWISCEERLPKENGCYLATVYELDTKRKVVKPRVFKNGHFYKGYCSTILAWQPLPPKFEG